VPQPTKRPQRERVPGTFHRRAKIAARARWSNPENRRVVRLDECDPDTQRLIRALLLQQEAARQRDQDAA
jgi:hypothetical protein